jgi:putative endonuclease
MPPVHRSYRVYIHANRKHGTIYTGVTNSLERRVWQHKEKQTDSFTRRYGVDRLVYFEEFRDVRNAIARETEIKGWLRARKVALIEKDNPEWNDLTAGGIRDKAPGIRPLACPFERSEESTATRTQRIRTRGFFAALRMTNCGLPA